LAAGEPGYESDTGKLKIGDGTTPWNNLAYYGDNFKVLTDGSLVYTTKNNKDLLGLAGFDNAAQGTIPIKGNGALTWIDLTTSVENTITNSQTIQDAIVAKIQQELNNNGSIKFKGIAYLVSND